MKRIFILLSVLWLLPFTVLLAQTDSTAAPIVLPVDLPATVQNVIAVVMGAVATLIVMGIKLLSKRFKWELSGSNTKLLVMGIAGILTVTVFVISGTFSNIEGFWNIALSVISNSAIIVGSAETIYGQLLARIKK